jgi:hypothetical protein
MSVKKKTTNEKPVKEKIPLYAMYIRPFLTEKNRAKLDRIARKSGYKNQTSYVRDVILNILENE